MCIEHRVHTPKLLTDRLHKSVACVKLYSVCACVFVFVSECTRVSPQPTWEMVECFVCTFSISFLKMKSQSFTGTLAKIAKDAFASLLIAAVMVMVIAKDWK